MDQAQGLRNIIKKNTIHENIPTARVITVTSGKGGVGKSSLSVNLAIEMSRRGKKVVIFDADFGLANIEVMLGLRPEYNLADLMFRGKTLTDIITPAPENIGFISGGSGINELANLNRDQVYSLIQRLNELDNMADIIIVDTGAGIADSVLEFVAASSEVILVATSEPTSITDAYALLKTLNRNTGFAPENSTIKVVANQMSNDHEAKELYDKLNLVVTKFLNINLEFLGQIPYDRKMQKAVIRQTPICMSEQTSMSAQAVSAITDKLLNIEVKAEGHGIMNLFSNVIRSRFRK